MGKLDWFGWFMLVIVPITVIIILWLGFIGILGGWRRGELIDERFERTRIQGSMIIVKDGYTGHSYLFIEGTGGVWLRPTKEEKKNERVP